MVHPQNVISIMHRDAFVHIYNSRWPTENNNCKWHLQWHVTIGFVNAANPICNNRNPLSIRDFANGKSIHNDKTYYLLLYKSKKRDNLVLYWSAGRFPVVILHLPEFLHGIVNLSTQHVALNLFHFGNVRECPENGLAIATAMASKFFV